MSTRHTIQMLSVGALFVSLIGCGGSAGVAPSSPVKYAFVGNRAESSISRYSVDATGALTSIGAPATTVHNPGGMVTTPDGKFLYSANFEGQIEMFAVGVNGSLSPLSTPTVALPIGNYGIAITPNGKYVYATSQDNNIYQFIVGADGVLTTNWFVSGGGLDNPVQIAVSPNGKFAYVSSYDNNTLLCYTIGANGQLSPNGPAVLDNISGPWSIEFSPSGQHLYVANSFSNTIAEFKINNDGTLNPLAPTTVNAPGECYGVAVSKVNNKLFASGYSDTMTKRFNLNGGTGVLSELNSAYDSGQSSQWPIAVSPQNLVYICNQTSNSVSTYGISADGTLSLIGTTKAGKEPASIAFVK